MAGRVERLAQLEDRVIGSECRPFRQINIHGGRKRLPGSDQMDTTESARRVPLAALNAAPRDPLPVVRDRSVQTDAPCLPGLQRVHVHARGGDGRFHRPSDGRAGRDDPRTTIPANAAPGSLLLIEDGSDRVDGDLVIAVPSGRREEQLDAFVGIGGRVVFGRTDMQLVRVGHVAERAHVPRLLVVAKPESRAPRRRPCHEPVRHRLQRLSRPPRRFVELAVNFDSLSRPRPRRPGPGRPSARR